MAIFDISGHNLWLKVKEKFLSKTDAQNTYYTITQAQTDKTTAGNTYVAQANIENNLTTASTTVGHVLDARMGNTLNAAINERPKVYTGTAAPGSSTGAVGDLYIQT